MIKESGLVPHFAFVALLIYSADLHSSESAYKLGVFPYLPPVQLEDLFVPIAIDFSTALDHKVIFRTTSTFEKYMERVAAQTYDILLIQPFYYVEAADQYSYLPLARYNKPLSALVMVKKESSFQSLSHLKKGIIVTPPKTSAVSYLFAAMLKQADIDPSTDVTIRHVREHVSCQQQVIIGKADACITTLFRMGNSDSTFRKRLRILAKSPSIPHTLFAIHPRIPEAQRNTIKKRILNWPNTSSGKTIINSLGFGEFVPATDSEYAPVRHYLKTIPH